MTEDGVTAVPLDPAELRLLRAGLLEWGGPARPTDALASAMGFTDAARLSAETRALWQRIKADEGLTATDWRRVLLAVEIVFVSDVVGSGLDWRLTTGITDVEAITVLRGLQRKMPRWRGSAQFTSERTGHVAISDPKRPLP